MTRESPGAVSFQLSDRAIHSLYIAIGAANALLIFTTLVSDLRLPLSGTWVLNQMALTREENIAVWYSSALLLADGVLALAIAGERPTSIQSSWYRLAWTMFAVAFIGLSIDETAQIHEKIGASFTRRVGALPALTAGTSAKPFFAWLLVLAPAILAFVGGMVLAARWWLRFHARSRILTLAATGCWIVVIGAEIVEAQLARWSLERSVQGVIEEGFEITGSALFFAGFVEFLRANAKARIKTS